MTLDQYRHRVERAFRACEWGSDNPYRAIIANRLSEAGGLHAPPPTADRFTEAEQWRVDHARETAEAKVEGGSPF